MENKYDTMFANAQAAFKLCAEIRDDLFPGEGPHYQSYYAAEDAMNGCTKLMKGLYPLVFNAKRTAPDSEADHEN